MQKEKKQSSPLQKALNLWAVILIVWAFYRAKLQMPIWFDEFIAKPIVFVLPIFWYIKKKEKTSLIKGLDLRLKTIPRDLFLGVFLGVIFLLTAGISIYFRWQKINILPFNQWLNLIITGLATAISEEILSRGFVLKRLYQESKNAFSSSFFASILFFFLHIPILFTSQKMTGNLLLIVMGVDIIFSFINSLIFIEYGLFLPVLIHFFYNLSFSLLI